MLDVHTPGPLPTPLALVGGGGHALVVAEAATLSGMHVLGVFDDDSSCVAVKTAGLAHLGTLADLAEALDSSSRLSRRGMRLILALGSIATRRALLHAHDADGRITALAATVTHPAASVSRSASIGAGCYIGPNAVVHSFARIGAHGIINSAAVVEHECQIGVNVHIAPRCALGGRVRAGDDTLIGIGATVLPGAVIGSAATIGAGAVVVDAVGDRRTVTGVPARER